MFDNMTYSFCCFTANLCFSFFLYKINVVKKNTAFANSCKTSIIELCHFNQTLPVNRFLISTKSHKVLSKLANKLLKRHFSFHTSLELRFLLDFDLKKFRIVRHHLSSPNYSFRAFNIINRQKTIKRATT